jgi:hypothetical protein
MYAFYACLMYLMYTQVAQTSVAQQHDKQLTMQLSANLGKRNVTQVCLDCLLCMPYMYALYVCLIPVPVMYACMHALYVCLIPVPVMYACMYALYVCLIPVPVMYACLVCEPAYQPLSYVLDVCCICVS